MSAVPGSGRPLETGSQPYSYVANLVWASVEHAKAGARIGALGDRGLCDLLRGMRETHEAMRAIMRLAKGTEADGEKTGVWADTLSLARSQFDSVFVGLLLAHDEQLWVPDYHRAGWAAMARRSMLQASQFGPAYGSIRNQNIRKLKQLARTAKITKKAWIATTFPLRDRSLRFGAESKDAVRAFPTPGQIVNNQYLANGAYADLVGWRGSM